MKNQLLNRILIRKTLFVLSTLLLSFFNLFAQQPELIWFGTFGGNFSEARAVASGGSVVVGVANNLNGDPRAFRWTQATGIQDLGTLGGDWSEATDISADGSVIVGWAYDANGIYRSFKWTAATGMQDLGAGDYSKASAVSADGSVVTVNVNQMAYRWTQSGGLQNLGNLGGDWTDASDVSSNGLVITGFSRNSSTDPYAFRWVDGVGMEQIGTFYSFARGISGDGNTITGFETGSAGIYLAFKWTQSGGFQFNIAGNFSEGNAVSGDGSIIVGDNGNGAFRLSTAGGLESLNQVYSGLLTPGSDLYTALGISTDGQFIVGYGFNGSTGKEEGFLIAVNGITSLKESSHNPEGFVLDQNYPNPFNPSTKIQYQVSSLSHVTLKVYDVLGDEVATLVNEEKPAGSYEVEFSVGRDSSPAIASGIYFYKIIAGSLIQTRKMILVK